MGVIAQGAEVGTTMPIPLEISVPHISSQLFDYPGDSQANVWSPYGFIMIQEQSGSSLNFPLLTQATSIGEDFNFVYFLGCPAIGASSFYNDTGFNAAT
jgi:hypothetical protein